MMFLALGGDPINDLTVERDSLKNEIEIIDPTCIRHIREYITQRYARKGGISTTPIEIDLVLKGCKDRVDTIRLALEDVLGTLGLIPSEYAPVTLIYSRVYLPTKEGIAQAQRIISMIDMVLGSPDLEKISIGDLGSIATEIMMLKKYIQEVVDGITELIDTVKKNMSMHKWR